MANSFQQLADTLGIETARLSGDPQRMNMALGSIEQRKATESDNLLNQQIDLMTLPDTQKALLKAMDLKTKYSTLFPSAGQPSLERLGVYDPETRQLIRTVLKSDLSGIQQLESAGLIIGALRSPTVPTSKDNQIDTWAVTNSDGIRVNDLVNPTKAELDEVVKAGNFINKTPVLSTAGKGLEKGLGEIKGWNDKNGLLERAMGYKGLVRSGDRIIKNLYENPESVLVIGDIAQVYDQIGQELKAIGAIASPEARDAFINKSPEGQDNSKIRDQFRELANNTSLTESQLLDFAYQIAKVRGQEGRGLSDQDFKNFQKIISAGRTAEQKAAALTNFIQGIKVEVQGALEDERDYRNATLARLPDSKEASAVVMGIQDVFSTGFSDIQNPFDQQTLPSTTSMPNDLPRVRITL